MKKTALFLTFVLTLSAVSCESKKPENALSEPVPETEEPAEPVFTEYFPEDFREIKVNFDYQEGEPPIEVRLCETDLRLTPKMSPCKANAIVDREHIPESGFICVEASNIYDSTLTGSDRRLTEDEILENKKNVVENPAAYLNANTIAYSDGFFYYMVNYDNLCRNSHCFDIMALDISKGTSETVWSYSGDNSVSINYMVCCGGSLYVDMTYFDENDEDIYNSRTIEQGTYIIKNGQPEMIDISEIDKTNNIPRISRSFTERLVMESSSYTINEKEGRVTRVDYALWEHDPDAMGWNEIGAYSSGEDFEEKIVGVGGNIVRSDKDGDGRASCTLDGRYTINTGLRGLNFKTADESKAVFAISDTVGNRILYIYDRDKGERYDYDLSSEFADNSAVYPLGRDWLYVARDNSDDLLLLPAVGAAFRGAKANRRFTDRGKVVSVEFLDENGESSRDVYRREYFNGGMYVYDPNAAVEHSQAVRIKIYGE